MVSLFIPPTEKVVLTMFGKQKRQAATRAAEVIAEASAILLGADRNSGSVASPGWVRINQLAHASWGELALLAERQTFNVPWAGAVSYLASEIRTQAGSAGGLLALQRHCLIPLELDVLGGRTLSPKTPLRLISSVRAEVDKLRGCPAPTSEHQR
jgi:hypothetical protein